MGGGRDKGGWRDKGGGTYTVDMSAAWTGGESAAWTGGDSAGGPLVNLE